MKLKQLFEAIDNFKVSGIASDSNLVRDNFVFVAIKGTREDGHKFIPDAIRRGAKVVVYESEASCLQIDKGSHKLLENISFVKVPNTRKALAELAAKFYHNPSARMKVVGVTGTNGKTTITYLMEAVLKEARFRPAVIGTINYRFKGKSIFSKNTTPPALELQAMFAQMLKMGIDYVVMEVSSHALEQERTAGINFSSAIFTNLTQDHLDYHKNLENYFRAKARLFKGLSKGAKAIINNDDRYARRLKSLTKAKVITYSIDSVSDLRAFDIIFSPAQTKFSLKGKNFKTDFKINLIGRHNVYNVLAVIAWGLGEGISLLKIKSAIEKFKFVPGRLERVTGTGEFSVFVDYAHTEDALKNVISSLRQVCDKKIIVVFGCGGERDKGKRPKMGKVVTELADYAIITNDNPRSESPGEIIADIEAGIKKNNYTVIPQRSRAIKESLKLSGVGDIVLIAGKGHENYQILKTQKRHFDDREVVKECLR